MITKIEYTVSENKLIIVTGIEPVGNVSFYDIDEMQRNWMDEESSLIRSEIIGLHRLPKMEQDRVIAQFYAEPKERAAMKKQADELAAAEAKRIKKATAQKAREDAEAAKENLVEIPTAKRTHKVIDAFASEHGIADSEEYQNAETKAEKVAVLEAVTMKLEGE